MNWLIRFLRFILYWIKRQFKKLLEFLVNWFANHIKRPRFWTEEEWNRKAPKEQCWVFYKHHLYLKGLGSAEADQVTMPVKDFLVLGGVIFLVAESFLAEAGIEIGSKSLMFFVGLACLIAWIANFALQWFLGNEIDKRDFPALQSEITNKRDQAMRDIRKNTDKEKWRQKT